MERSSITQMGGKRGQVSLIPATSCTSFRLNRSRPLLLSKEAAGFSLCRGVWNLRPALRHYGDSCTGAGTAAVRPRRTGSAGQVSRSACESGSGAETGGSDAVLSGRSLPSALIWRRCADSRICRRPGPVPASRPSPCESAGLRRGVPGGARVPLSELPSRADLDAAVLAVMAALRAVRAEGRACKTDRDRDHAALSFDPGNPIAGQAEYHLRVGQDCLPSWFEWPQPTQYKASRLTSR